MSDLKKRRLTGLAYIVIIIAINTVAWFFLPDHLVMQITGEGEAGFTLPKLLGLGLMVMLGGLSGMHLVLDRKETDDKRWLIAMLIILVINLVVIVFNI